MANNNTPLAVAIKGAVAGLVGSGVLSVLMPRMPEMLEQLGLLHSAPKIEPAQPTGKLAQKLAKGIFHQQLEVDTRQAAGQAIHWSYGAGWGAFYGIVQSSLRLPHLLHGTLLGILLGSVASTLIPALGLTKPPQKQQMPINAGLFVLHLIYGWTVAQVFHLLGGDAGK